MVNNTARCDCHPFYTGALCQYFWGDDINYMKVVTAYQVINVLAFACLTAWCVWELYQALCTSTGWEKLSVVTYSIALYGGGSFIHMVIYAIDAHGFRSNMSPLAFFIVSTVPLAMWTSAGYGIALFWVQLNKQRGKSQIEFLPGLKPLLVIMCVLCWILYISAAFWAGYEPALPAYIYYGLVAIVTILIFVAVTVIFGVKLAHQMRGTRVTTMKSFMWRMIHHMIWISILMVIIIITTAALIVTGGLGRYGFIIFYFFITTEEFLMVLSGILLFRRKKPKSDGSGQTKTDELVQLPQSYDTAVTGHTVSTQPDTM